MFCTTTTEEVFVVEHGFVIVRNVVLGSACWLGWYWYNVAVQMVERVTRVRKRDGCILVGFGGGGPIVERV